MMMCTLAPPLRGRDCSQSEGRCAHHPCHDWQLVQHLTYYLKLESVTRKCARVCASSASSEFLPRGNRNYRYQRSRGHPRASAFTLPSGILDEVFLHGDASGRSFIEQLLRNKTWTGVYDQVCAEFTSCCISPIAPANDCSRSASLLIPESPGADP